MLPLTGAVDGNFNVWACENERGDEKAHRNGLAKPPGCRNPVKNSVASRCVLSTWTLHGRVEVLKPPHCGKSDTHRISWLMLCQVFISRRRGYERSKNPGGSVLKRTRTTEFRKDSCRQVHDFKKTQAFVVECYNSTGFHC